MLAVLFTQNKEFGHLCAIPCAPDHPMELCSVDEKITQRTYCVRELYFAISYGPPQSGLARPSLMNDDNESLDACWPAAAGGITMAGY